MATPKVRSRRPTRKQIAALKYLIAESEYGTDLTKRILFLLINASQGMTRPVSVSLTQDCQGYTAEEIRAAAHGLGSMQSSNCSMHLGEMMSLMGAGLCFSTHYGSYDAEEHFSTYGQFAFQDGGYDAPMRYTFWLAGHSGSGWRLRASRKRLDAIQLGRPGLYPSLEKEVEARAIKPPAPESATL